MNTSAEKTAYRAYRIQLTPSQLSLAGTLGLVGVLVSFYLGVVVGEYLYTEPPKSVTVQNAASEKTESQPPQTVPEDLKFFELGDKNTEPKETLNIQRWKELKKNTQRLQEKAALAAKSEKASTPPPKKEVVQPQAPTVKTPTVAQPTVTPPQKPAAPKLVETKRADTYTIQVLSSQSRENADALVRQLRRRGIEDAYVHTYVNPSQKTLYRVRVGKLKKGSAEKQALQLKQFPFIDSVQVTKL